MYTTLSNASQQSNVPIERFYTYGRNVNNGDFSQTEIIIRDSAYPYNKYWVKFPPTWRTSEQKERIIGIRSIWQDEAIRLIEFDINCGTMMHISFALYSSRPISITLQEVIDKKYPDNNIRVRPEVNDYNEYCLVFETRDGTGISSITNMSDDAINVFNNFDKDGNPLNYKMATEGKCVFSNIWDRVWFMVTSSIASNTSKNEIGFAGVRYMPIKYFRINSNQTGFWLELWNGHYMNTPANLPKDGKDALTLEMIFLHDMDDSLYT